MNWTNLECLRAELEAVTVEYPLGRLIDASGALIRAGGMGADARLGARVRLHVDGQRPIGGEVVRIEGDSALIIPDRGIDGARLGDRIELLGELTIAPHDGWLGRIVDPDGQPLDGRPLLRGPRPRALRAEPPPASGRRRLGNRLETGLRAFNTVLPLVRGQRLGLFAGSGVGKSSLLGALARGVDADVAVIALVGERGRELREFVETSLGPRGLDRSVIVAATSDQSPMRRRQCALSAMAIAEHFRDEGKHVLFLADSVTRMAEAHREVAVAAGEAASLRGFPPSTSSQLMALAERAGPGQADVGDITAVFTVLVAGSDMEEPIADILRGVLDGHVVLDRQIAERGRYPAIDLLRSVSRSLPAAATERENRLISRARRLLGAYDRAEPMIQAGLYAAGSDPDIDRAIQVWPALDAFLGEAEPEDAEASFSALARILDEA